MTDAFGSRDVPPASQFAAPRYYKRDFWGAENLKFTKPWYRLDKSARLLTRLARGRSCALLDVGCGPAALMRALPPSIDYYGIDIAIQHPAPNLIEADLIESPICWGDKKFDIVSALGVFEYFGDQQVAKFAEIARIIRPGGKFVVTYTNFGHRRPYVYPAFSNVQSIGSFRRDLRRHFSIDRSFPVSHNWKHGHPSRRLLRAVNMPLKLSIPALSRLFAVEYYFICSPLTRGDDDNSADVPR